MYNTHFNIK